MNAILAELGGPGFIGETGVAIVSGNNDLVDFSLPDNSSGANILRIERVIEYQYRMRLCHVAGMDVEEKHIELVERRQLRQRFCALTGLCDE